MGSEWVQTTIGDFLEQHGGEIKTGPFGTKLKASEYSEVGVPVISVGEVQLGRLTLHERTPKVDVDVIARMPEYLLKTGDIVFGRKGAVERSARVRSEEEGWFLGSDGIRLRLPECCDSRFIAYSFLTEAHKQWMVQHAAGTTMASLNEKIIRLIPLSLPPLPVQKAIADHLEIIDNKIALNRQINTTLESMAQALFKSWFVDFDPVIDNALAAGHEIPDALQKRAAARAARREALRQQTNKTANETTEATDADSPEQALPDTGLSDQRLPPEIQQLFPDRFVLTEEMGWVPEGWGIESLDRIANYQNGLALQKFRPEDESNFLPVVKIAQLKKGYADGEEKASPNIKPECIIDDGDVVFSWSGSLMVDVWCGGRAALNQHLFKVTSDEYPKWFFLHFTLHHLTEFQRIAADKAVTMGHIKREHLSQAKCSVPGMDFMEKLSPFFDPLLNKAVLSRLENRALIDLRDSLLPKLLSGQITIPDAEQQLAEVL